MGRKANASLEEAFEVMADLETANQPITIATVREKLSGGSLTTITKYVRAWRARSGIQIGAHPGLPPELTSSVISNVENIWKDLTQAADSETKKLKTEVKDLRHQVRQQGTTIETLKSEISELKTRRNRRKRTSTKE